LATVKKYFTITDSKANTCLVIIQSYRLTIDIYVLFGLILNEHTITCARGKTAFTIYDIANFDKNTFLANLQKNVKRDNSSAGKLLTNKEKNIIVKKLINDNEFYHFIKETIENIGAQYYIKQLCD